MRNCADPGCNAHSGMVGISLKSFPSDPERCALWMSMLKRDGWTPTGRAYLCEGHFDKDQWEKVRVDGKKKLKSSAVPTIFFKNRPPHRNRRVRQADASCIVKPKTSVDPAVCSTTGLAIPPQKTPSVQASKDDSEPRIITKQLLATYLQQGKPPQAIASSSQIHDINNQIHPVPDIDDATRLDASQGMEIELSPDVVYQISNVGCQDKRNVSVPGDVHFLSYLNDQETRIKPAPVALVKNVHTKETRNKRAPGNVSVGTILQLSKEKRKKKRFKRFPGKVARVTNVEAQNKSFKPISNNLDGAAILQLAKEKRIVLVSGKTKDCKTSPVTIFEAKEKRIEPFPVKIAPITNVEAQENELESVPVNVSLATRIIQADHMYSTRRQQPPSSPLPPDIPEDIDDQIDHISDIISDVTNLEPQEKRLEPVPDNVILLRKVDAQEKELVRQARLIRNLRIKILLARKAKYNDMCKEKKATKHLSQFLTENQIAALKVQSTRGFAWSNESLKKALHLKLACRTAGYKELLQQNYPLPSLRTLNRKIHTILADDIGTDSGIAEDVLEMRIAYKEMLHKYAETPCKNVVSRRHNAIKKQLRSLGSVSKEEAAALV